MDRRFVTTWVLLLSTLWTSQSLAYGSATDITYTMSTETISGYSETWKDPYDWDSESECVYWVFDDIYGYYCATYFYQENWVYTKNDVWMPDATYFHDGPDVYHWADARADWVVANISTFYAGRWNARGLHKVVQDYYWVYCPYNFCSSVPAGSSTYDLGEQWDHVDVCASSRSVIDGAVVNALLLWPAAEPWERAVTAFCGGNDVILFGYYNDSFGYFYGGTTPTNDPCQTRGGPVTVDRASGAHSHPFFHNEAEFHAGLGCFGDQDPASQQDIDNLNQLNEDFSSGDRTAISLTGKPLYLKTPLGTQIKRLDTSTQPNSITVYP